jgi:hypothetical protein
MSVKCSGLEWLESLHSVRRIGDGQVQQLNVHDYYELGKALGHADRELTKIEGPVALSSVSWTLFIARYRLLQRLEDPCALLSSTQRSARSLAAAITQFVPEDIEAAFNVDKSIQFYPYQASTISGAIKNFETVLKNDMPEMATFAVAQIGIYRTEDLIHRSHLQIEEELRPYLEELAKSDVIEAGKCLAFRVPTAAAFHLSRAIETGMNQYYEALTGKPFDLKDAAKNWAIKTQALKDAGADEKITEFLIHIRKAYRNPITHPDVILEAGEALGFFSQAVSVISIMLAAVKTIEEYEQLMLPGLGDGTGGSYAEATGESAAGVQSNDEESALGLEAGATETAGS